MKKIRSIIAKLWIRAILIILVCLIVSNFWFTHRIKSGLRDLAEKLKKENVCETEVFPWVGPSTADALKAVTKEDYSVSVWPLDGMHESILVTHTAYVKSKEKEIGVRIRLSLFDGHLHIVGFYTVQ